MYRVDFFDKLSPSIVLACLCVGLAFAPDWIIQSLAWNRSAICSGSLWRLWTGHLVHYSLQHASLDAIAVLVLGRVVEVHFGKCFVVVALLLSSLFISLALLWLFSNMLEYRGASSLATFLGVMAGFALWRSKPGSRGCLTMLAALFLAKVACDAWWFTMTWATLPIGVNVAWQIHLLSGIVAALYFSLFCSLLRGFFTSHLMKST